MTDRRHAGVETSTVVHIMMSFPALPDAGFSHAVREHETATLCGAEDVSGLAEWPELGQPWPAGPSRCSGCAQAMSAPERA